MTIYKVEAGLPRQGPVFIEMSPLIELKDITFRTDKGILLFNEAELSLYAGERVHIYGPFSSGKGVLVKFLAGLFKPDKGTISIYGTEITGLDRRKLDKVRRKVGFILEDSPLISNLKVIENVALPLLYHTPFGRDESMMKALKLLDEVGYSGDVWALPGVLPLYEKKLVAVARALALGPQVIVYENLTAGLTSTERTQIYGVLTKYHEGSIDRLLVFTSSNVDNAGQINASRVVRIEDHGFSG